jgi:opine dehydrogenase
MKGLKVAIIGAGHVGCAAAAHLAFDGHKVSLYELPQFGENLKSILARGGIELLGAGKTGFAKIDTVTTDIKEAIRDAQIILVVTVAMAHETVAELCVPHLRDNQTVALIPGNFGSLVFDMILKSRRPGLRVKLAESNMTTYACRRDPVKAEVTIRMFHKDLAFSAFPAIETEKALEDLKELYPGSFFAANNVAEVALSNPNPILHVGPILMMTGWIESSSKPIIWWDGITPSVLRVMEAVWRERKAVLKALGLRDLYPLKRIREEIIGDPGTRLLAGPSDLRHRFITENVPMSMVPWVSLGEMLFIPTPVSRSLVTIASEVNSVNYLAEGRNIERLGISGLSIQELRNVLYEGRQSLRGVSA